MEIIQIIIAVLVIIGIITTLFRRQYKMDVITGIFEKEFADIIEAVYYFKDDGGSGIATEIKGIDTPYCFSGMNYELNILYYGYAKKGDLIVKKERSNVFYIKRDSSLVSFELSECNR